MFSYLCAWIPSWNFWWSESAVQARSRSRARLVSLLAWVRFQYDCTGVVVRDWGIREKDATCWGDFTTTAMKSWVGHTTAMKRRQQTMSIAAEMVVAAHLLVFLVLIGGGCCFSGCRSGVRLCSSRASARAAAAVMYVNTVALAAPSMITMSNGRPMRCMSRALSRRRISASAAQRRRGAVWSEMTDSPWSTTGFNQACDGLSNDEGDNEHGCGNEHDAPEEVSILGQDEPRHDSWTSTGWDGGTNGTPYSSREQTEPAAPAFGGFEGEGNSLGSPEFVDLVKAQLEVLATALDASEIVLYVRRENAEPGAIVRWKGHLARAWRGYPPMWHPLSCSASFPPLWAYQQTFLVCSNQQRYIRPRRPSICVGEELKNMRTASAQTTAAIELCMASPTSLLSTRTAYGNGSLASTD